MELKKREKCKEGVLIFRHLYLNCSFCAQNVWCIFRHEPLDDSTKASAKQGKIRFTKGCYAGNFHRHFSCEIDESVDSYKRIPF